MSYNPNNKIKANSETNIVALGNFNFDLVLNIKSYSKTNNNLKSDFSSCNTIEDFEKLLSKNKDLEKHIQIKTTNLLLNILLIINRLSKVNQSQSTYINHCKIDFFGLSSLNISENAKSFERIISEKFLKQHNIKVIENNFFNGFAPTINFIVKISDLESKCVKLSKDINSEEINDKREEIPDQNNGKLFKNHNSFNNIEQNDYDYSKTKYFFFDINDFLNGQSIENETRILEFFSKYFKMLIDNHLNLKLICRFPLWSKISNNNADLVISVISFGDIFIIDKEEIVEILKNHENIRSRNINKNLDRDQMLWALRVIKNYRIKGVKTGLFLDNLNCFSYVEVIRESGHSYSNNTISFTTELKDLFKYYKDKEYVNKINKVIENNSDLLKSLFWGCYFSLIFDTKTPESACEAAVNSFKNSVKKFLMEEEEDHIMLVNNEKCFSIGEPKGISNKRIMNKSLEFIKSRDKENNFNLDCSNLIQSKMQPYNYLLDENMIYFFENTNVSSQLNKIKIKEPKGSTLYDINEKIIGHISLDSQNKLYKLYEEQHLKYFPKENELTKIIENKMKMDKSLTKNKDLSNRYHNNDIKPLEVFDKSVHSININNINNSNLSNCSNSGGSNNNLIVNKSYNNLFKRVNSNSLPYLANITGMSSIKNNEISIKHSPYILNIKPKKLKPLKQLSNNYPIGNSNLLINSIELKENSNNIATPKKNNKLE